MASARTIDRTSDSDTWPRLAVSDLDRKHNAARTIGKGLNSGKDFMAFFGNETILRTRHPLLLGDGRRNTEFGGVVERFPESTTIVPAGISIEEFVVSFPLHVWGKGLRLFMAGGWTAEQVYNRLPADTKHTAAKSTRWNYVRRAFAKQDQCMIDEETELLAEQKKAPGESSSSPIILTPSPWPEHVETWETTITALAKYKFEPPLIPHHALDSNFQFERPHRHPSVAQLRAIIHKEYGLLFAVDRDILGLIDPDFASLAGPTQRSRVVERLERLATGWEAHLLGSLPAEFHSQITIQVTSFDRTLQILRTIFDERPKYPIDPVPKEQEATTNWLAYLNLQNRMTLWREDAQNCLAELQARPVLG